ncbi:MAG: AHH domain-containing protein [Oscillospiraceae bacterium]|nr:AHH domain-containing protein [Oscillospiraceae bacterium]
MSKIITTGNCEFRCQSLIGSISAMESTNVNKTYNNEMILTEMAQLTCLGSCKILTAAAQGVSTPCPNALAAVPWTPESKESSIKINGISVLNHMAKKICPVGGVVSCTIKSPNNKLTKEINIESPFFSNSFVSESLFHSKSDAINSITVDNNNSSVKSDVEEKVTDNGYNNKSDEIKKRENSTKKINDQDVENIDDVGDVEYTLCNYKKCKYSSKCEYLKASHIYVCNQQESQVLRKNSKEMFEKYDIKDKEIQEKSRLSWTAAAHHLISARAVFKEYPELVKLANFYGYDINCSENCIYLPTNNEKGYAAQESVYKKAEAYEVMSLTGLQWHTGQHEYKIDSEEFNNIDSELSLKSYNEILHRYVEEKIIPIFTCNQCCRYDVKGKFIKEQKALEFKNIMNNYSNEIRKKLEAFSVPKSSYPYFVSAESMRYAYNVPKSGKIIFAIYNNQNGNDGWKLLLCKYSKLKKHENNVTVSEVESIIVDYNMHENISNIIEFCSNVRHFFIFDNKFNVEFPFKYLCNSYYIKSENSEYTVYKDGKSLKKCTVDSRLKSRDIISETGNLISAILVEDTELYISPSKMIIERKKECGVPI